jgi:hypothetical protein
MRSRSCQVPPRRCHPQIAPGAIFAPRPYCGRSRDLLLRLTNDKLPSCRPKLSFLCATKIPKNSTATPQRNKNQNAGEENRAPEYRPNTTSNHFRFHRQIKRAGLCSPGPGSLCRHWGFFSSQFRARPAHLSPFAGECQRRSRQADPPRGRQFPAGAAPPQRPADSRRSLLLYQRPLLPRQACVCQGLRVASAQYGRSAGHYGLRRPALSGNAVHQRRTLRNLLRAGGPI